MKTFDAPMDDEVRARICGIEPRTTLASVHKSVTCPDCELLITSFDGKPGDYDHLYRGKHRTEDTRQALFEARRKGISPFCVSIGEEGADYQPHMYGAAIYVVLDGVAKLPMKVSDIYRKLTS